MKAQNTYHKIMENFWLVVAILSLLVAVYKIGGAMSTGEDLENSLTFLFIPFVATILWMLRRGFRKRMEKNNME